MNSAFHNYFGSPEAGLSLDVSGELSHDSGYFQLGNNIICYGRTSKGHRDSRANGDLYDVSSDVFLQGSTVHLPFDPLEVIENLQRERYAAHFREEDKWWNSVLRAGYYIIRPHLTVPVRRHLQRFRLRGWDKIISPNGRSILPSIKFRSGSWLGPFEAAARIECRSFGSGPTITEAALSSPMM